MQDQEHLDADRIEREVERRLAADKEERRRRKKEKKRAKKLGLPDPYAPTPAQPIEHQERPHHRPMEENDEIDLPRDEWVQEPVKIRLPIPSFQDSDTEDEEVIISGNMRTKQLKNRAKSRKIKK